MARNRVSVTEVRRRGVGYFLSRCAIRGDVFEVARGRRGDVVGVIVPAERLASLERTERDAARGAAPRQP